MSNKGKELMVVSLVDKGDNILLVKKLSWNSTFEQIVLDKKIFLEKCYSLAPFINKTSTELELMTNVISLLFKVGEICDDNLLIYMSLKMKYKV